MSSLAPRSPRQTSAPRVLQVCAVDFTARHFLLPLMRAQRTWGFEVEFACSPGPDVPALQAEGFSYHPVGIPRRADPTAFYSAWRSLLALLRSEHFDVVHLHTPVAALLGRPAARRARVPIVLYTAHGFYFHEGMPGVERAVHVALERRAQRHADYLLTQSREDAEAALRHRIATPGRVLAIGNGVDLGAFHAASDRGEIRRAVRAEFDFEPAAPLVVMMGRLVREKGYPELLEAWRHVLAQCPRARLLCIGPQLATDRGGFAAEAARLLARPPLLGAVALAGFRADVARLLQAADLFVLPSRREGMPRSILEAMACGLPVVATDIRGAREEVVPGETGRLVPPGDPQALGRALVDLLLDEASRRRMGAAARLRAENLFDEAAVIARQQALYRQLFEEKGLRWPGQADPP